MRRAGIPESSVHKKAACARAREGARTRRVGHRSCSRTGAAAAPPANNLGPRALAAAAPAAAVKRARGVRSGGAGQARLRAEEPLWEEGMHGADATASERRGSGRN